jgi:hypothetical protein
MYVQRIGIRPCDLKIVKDSLIVAGTATRCIKRVCLDGSSSDGGIEHFTSLWTASTSQQGNRDTSRRVRLSPPTKLCTMREHVVKRGLRCAFSNYHDLTLALRRGGYKQRRLCLRCRGRALSTLITRNTGVIPGRGIVWSSQSAEEQLLCWKLLAM